MQYFNYESIAAEARITTEQLKELADLMRLEFPHDPMMAELHVLRVCMAIRDGRLTIEEALSQRTAVA